MANISFALTTEQVRARTKRVTRRIGWSRCRVGQILQPVVRGQGIPKGGKVERLGGPIVLVSVGRERISDLLRLPDGGRSEVDLEGFPDMTPIDFVAFFCKANGVSSSCLVNRLEFDYLDAAVPDLFVEHRRHLVDGVEPIARGHVGTLRAAVHGVVTGAEVLVEGQRLLRVELSTDGSTAGLLEKRLRGIPVRGGWVADVTVNMDGWLSPSIVSVGPAAQSWLFRTDAVRVRAKDGLLFSWHERTGVEP